MGQKDRIVLLALFVSWRLPPINPEGPILATSHMKIPDCGTDHLEIVASYTILSPINAD